MVFPSMKLINKLKSVQNAAARVIACLRKFDHISDTRKEYYYY